MSLGGSFSSSATGRFVFFLIVALIVSEWSNVVNARDDSQYQRSESYTGMRCRPDSCDESCKSEGNTAGGICRRGSMLHLLKKCYCTISPATEDAAGPAAPAAEDASGPAAPAAEDAAGPAAPAAEDAAGSGALAAEDAAGPAAPAADI